MAVSRIDEAGLNVTQYGNRNLIINGAMQVAQRGTSFTSISSGSGYTLDRWAYEFSGTTDGVISIEQVSDAPDGYASSLKVTTTTANSAPDATARVQIRQRFEGFDVQQLDYGSANAKSFTLSFWVKSTKTGTQTIGLYKVDGNNVASQNYTVNSSGVWEHKSIVISGDTANAIANDNTHAFQIGFGLVAGSNYTSGTADGTWRTGSANQFPGCPNNLDTIGNIFAITGVQLEVGDTATGFEHRSYADELARCQRYYYQIAGNAKFVGHGFYFSSSEFDVEVNFPVTMRAAPTFTSSSSPNDFRIVPWVDDFNAFSGSQYFDGNKMNLWNSSGVSGTKGDAGMVSMRNASTSKVQFDAEL